MRVQGAISFRSLDDAAVGPGCLAEHLETFGVVLFFDATRESLAEALASWTVMFRHPHAAADGATVLRPDGRSSGAGFSRAALGPHTDRAQVADPPAVVAVLVEQPADVGGESLLVDAASDGALLHMALQAPERLVLCGAEDTRRPVFEMQGGRVRTRYRDDALARPIAVDEAGDVVLVGIRAMVRAARAGMRCVGRRIRHRRRSGSPGLRPSSARRPAGASRPRAPVRR